VAGGDQIPLGDLPGFFQSLIGFLIEVDVEPTLKLAERGAMRKPPS
jgi:hypothetical protein